MHGWGRERFGGSDESQLALLEIGFQKAVKTCSLVPSYSFVIIFFSLLE